VALRVVQVEVHLLEEEEMVGQEIHHLLVHHKVTMVEVVQELRLVTWVLKEVEEKVQLEELPSLLLVEQAELEKTIIIKLDLILFMQVEEAVELVAITAQVLQEQQDQQQVEMEEALQQAVVIMEAQELLTEEAAVVVVA
jgi:hypothetical protein